MNEYSRITRKRLEAAFRVKMRRKPSNDGRPVPWPTMDPPEELPSEIIDLASGPFASRFPELVRRRKRK